MTQETLVAVQKKPAFAAGELTERIIAEKQGSIGWLTFNNPARRNAISIDMWEAIPKVLDRFERDSEVRVIVLKGEGDKAFVSGADVSQYERDRSTAEGIQRYEEIAGRVAERLQTCGEVIITGRQFKAEEAKTMGFVHRVAPVAELEALVLEYCAMISENAPLTIRASKRIVRELLKGSASLDAEACAALVKACFESQDYIEGRRAFMEKRKPVFQGK